MWEAAVLWFALGALGVIIAAWIAFAVVVVMIQKALWK